MSDKTVAVILAGVHDWGACPLHRACAKPLAPIANRSMMETVLLRLRDGGVTDVVICSNGLSETMQKSLGDGSSLGMQVSYRDDAMPRGPAGCVKDATAGMTFSEVMVVESSIIPLFNIRSMILAHRQSRPALTVAAKPVSNNDDAHSPVGVYVFSPQSLDHIGASGFQDIKESLIPALHRDGERADVYRIIGQAPRLTGIASYFALNDWALKRSAIGAWEADGYYVEGSTLIHINAKVATSAKLLGPVMVGPDAVVEEHAIVVGPTSIGAGSRVGRRAIVSRSSIWSNATIDAAAHVDRCLVAHDATVAGDDRYVHMVFLTDDRIDAAAGRGSDTAGSTGDVSGDPAAMTLAESVTCATDKLGK